MAIIDSLKWEGNPDIFAWKYPETNLTTWTQLVVSESQEAILLHKGKLIAKFGPGKHTLSTENIPVLENLFGIPFGGKNPFTAEVWFINKVFSLDLKWGTPQPINLRDPQYSIIIPIRAYGQFGVRIEDSEKFLISLVGTLQYFDREYLTRYFRGLILSNATSIISKAVLDEKIFILDISTQTTLLSEKMTEELKDDFEKFGINLVNFYISQISFTEDDKDVKRLKDLLAKKAEMDLLGYTYQQERSFDVLENAAQNEGSAGTVMGAGLGLGMGFGVGGAVGGMAGGMAQGMQNNLNTSFTPPAAVNVTGKFCKECGSKLDANDKFCSNCGTTVAKQCGKCSSMAESGDKFCSNCGNPL